MTLGHAKVAYTPRELDWRGLRFGRLGISIDTEWKTSLFLPLSLTLSLLNLYYIQCHGGRYYSGITRNKVGSRKERNKIKSRTRSANMTADHYLVLSAPSTAESRAVDSKQSARTKPNGFALTALCECRAFWTKAMEDSRPCLYLAEHGDISRKPPCHLYT